MHPLYDELIKCLESEDKKESVKLILNKLDTKEIDIITLYREVLAPAQNQLVCWQDDFFCIWKEHVRTSIARTIVECCYPYAVRESERLGNRRDGKIIIGCPAEEYHELGPRMVADFFTMQGFDVIFVGANTPQREIMAALEDIKPKAIGISVTNNHNMEAAKKLVKDLKDIRHEKNLDFKIIVGGNAFRMNPDVHKDMGVDAVLQNYEDIKRFCQGI